MSDNATIVAKLSLKAMKAAPARNSVEDGKPIVIAYIYGAASKHEVVESAFGDSTRFVGNFEGENMAGETFRSSKCFLPSVVEDLLCEAIDNAPEGAAVEFGFEIGAQYSEKGNTGYAYTVKPIAKFAKSDALASLRSQIHAVMKALPKPEQEQEKTVATGGKKK